MTDQHRDTRQNPQSPQAPTASRQSYEAPRLVKYGDIATLTRTSGLTKIDQGQKKQRIG